MAEVNTEHRRWKTVRFFISSTFRDMHAERDYLIKYVFPDLRQWCEKYRLHIVDIDLRWGVTREEAESGKVIDICLNEIDGSRPFFLCILGNRYGWVPDEKDIPADTFIRYNRLTEERKKSFSITHMEIHHAVFEPLTSLDDLEEVPHSFFYFRDPESTPDPSHLTEFTAAEKEVYRNTFFDNDPSLTDRLQYLKENIRDHFRDAGRLKQNPDEVDERIFHYTPLFDPSLGNPEDDSLRGRFTPGSLKAFGNRVMEDMKRAVLMEFAERVEALSSEADDDPLAEEHDQQELFVENRTRLFVGREELLDRLIGYVQMDGNGQSADTIEEQERRNSILAVFGDSGSGKSALLSRLYRQLRYTQGGEIRNPGVQMIPHFVGASEFSASQSGLLRRLCFEIAGFVKKGMDDGEWSSSIFSDIPGDGSKLPETFRLFISMVPHRLIIILDGLNQLDEEGYAQRLNWLPETLPENVKIIASALEGEAMDSLQRKTGLQMYVTPLNESERREIIRLMPSVFSKTLEERHIELLLQKKETENPLYLKIALEELRVFGSFEKLGELIEALPSDLVDMFVFVLDRLERDHEAAHGVVERLFCLIEVSRYGLPEYAVEELMNLSDSERVHSVILRGIRDYIHYRGDLIDFFHRGVSKAVRKKYLSGPDGDKKKREWHAVLADYYASAGLDDPDRVKHKCVEQPWQQLQARQYDQLVATLTDLTFIEAKIGNGLYSELLDDYRRAEESLGEPYTRRDPK